MLSGEAVGIRCNRGNSVQGSHAVFLNVGAQIFFQPSAVSTELTFLTRLIVLKRFSL